MNLSKVTIDGDVKKETVNLQKTLSFRFDCMWGKNIKKVIKICVLWIYLPLLTVNPHSLGHVLVKVDVCDVQLHKKACFLGNKVEVYLYYI